MPRIDPEKLLNCIGVLLSPNGGIRSSAEVKRLSGLMEKYCKKLVSKCIYIQILKCTDTELLGEFMEAGGWKLVHAWLKEGIETRNWPLAQELLELLLLCPVDVPRLQSNDAPRLVKGLSREGSGNDGVRILAARLVEQWLKIAKGETMTIASQNLIIVNKEYVQSSHPSIILNNNKGILYSDPNKDGIDESESLDEPMTVNGIIDRDENDSDRDVDNENNCNEALVYKFTVKDGKQVLAKVSDSSSPKKSNNQISRGNDSAITADTDESKLLKVRNTNTSNSSIDKKSKDEKDSGGKQSSSDRSKSKDRSRDKDRKSGSSSSSSHKTISSSSKFSSSSSSSKHSSSSNNHSNSSNSSKSHKSSSGSSSSKSGSSSGSSSSRDKSKDKHRSSSSKSSSSSSSSRDKDKRDDKDSKSKSEVSKLSQADQDKATLAKVLPQAITKIGKIPKKPSSGDDKSSNETTTDDDKKVISAKKKSISIEVRKDADRPKTVKTYNSQFRSHGLAEEAPPPPSRRDLKKPSTTPTPGASIPTPTPVIGGKRSLSPTSSATKDIEKKIKVSSPTSEKPGAIKLIPAKPKPSVLVESDMFMDAISAATSKKEVRKRKRSKESESSATTKESNGKAAVPAAPMKFYQDTLDDSDAKEDKIKEENIKQENETDDSKFKLKKSKLDDDSADESVAIKEESDIKMEEPLEEEVFENIKREPGIGCGPDGPPGVLTLHRRKGPKKSLRWRPQEALEEIRYFELDENERVNVTKTFVDAKQMEHVSEREAFLIARKSGTEDIMVEQIPWAPLIPVDDVPVPAVITSKEKDIQTEREKTCLKTIYFNRSMIPDSPSEPDVIAYQNIEPKIMPLFDITGNPDAVHDFSNLPWPEPKGSPQHTAGTIDDLNGFANFGQFGQTQFGNMNWPLGQQPNNMMNLRPPQAMTPFGAMLPPDALNQMAFPRTMNPAMPTNFGPNGPPAGFINNFGAPMQAIGRGGNGPQNNWFGNMNGGGGGGGANNNWQTQQPMAANNVNNARPGWQGRRLCKQFQRGFCRHGDTCKFLHPGVNCPPF